MCVCAYELPVDVLTNVSNFIGIRNDPANVKHMPVVAFDKYIAKQQTYNTY